MPSGVTRLSQHRFQRAPAMIAGVEHRSRAGRVLRFQTANRVPQGTTLMFDGATGFSRRDFLGAAAGCLAAPLVLAQGGDDQAGWIDAHAHVWNDDVAK